MNNDNSENLLGVAHLSTPRCEKFNNMPYKKTARSLIVHNYDLNSF